MEKGDVRRPAPRPPCPFTVRSSLADHCRGRRPRRPAEVGGGGKVRGRDESLPYGLPVSGSWPGGGGGVKTPPYDAKDKRAAMARPRAGHARPLQGDVNGLRTRGAREGGSPPLRSGRRLPVDGWQRKARQSPSGLASSASSPERGAFCAGEAREKSLPCQREVPSASEAEGFLAVCGGNGQSGKARRNPPVR